MWADSTPRRYYSRGSPHDRSKHETAGVASDVLHTDVDSIRGLKPSLVIDALPGIEPSCNLLAHFLSAGVSAVSANKAVVAAHGLRLTEIA